MHGISAGVKAEVVWSAGYRMLEVTPLGLAIAPRTLHSISPTLPVLRFFMLASLVLCRKERWKQGAPFCKVCAVFPP